MNKYSNACSEIYTILKELEDDDYAKIPSDIIEVIDENRNLDYKYELDDNLELKYQKMLPETKAILFNLFRDYLCEPWQREKIIIMQNEERQRNEEEKKQQYNTDVFANKTKGNSKQSKEESVEMIEYKENTFKRILNKIKKYFSKK